jgi:hypothetical protein
MTNLLTRELRVINIGLTQFMEALEVQDIPVVHIQWSPPTEDDAEIQNLLDSLL